METKRWYETRSYDTEFESKIVAVKQVKQQLLVALEGTLFFPEEGGQLCDEGTLGGHRVEHVSIQNGVIWHHLSLEHKGVFQEEDMVTGHIDWEHRIDQMQQHTGEHIFSGLVYRYFGYQNVGFHLSKNRVTMDYNGTFLEDELLELEEKANRVIRENRKIRCFYPTKTELEQLTYRSKIEIEQDLRLVDIDGVDLCACCAPHVSYTGEVGGLKILSMQHYKGGSRLELMCGMRWLLYAQQQQQILSQLSTRLSAPMNELPQALERLQTQFEDCRYELNGRKREEFLEVVKKGIEQKQSFLFLENIELKNLRDGVNLMKESRQEYCGIFSAIENEKYEFVLGSSTLDCKKVAEIFRQKKQARCGGSFEMIQGSIVGNEQEIRELLNEISTI